MCVMFVLRHVVSLNNDGRLVMMEFLFLFLLLSRVGNNILFVGIYGPKTPCEEFQIKHTGRNNYNVNYYVKERGDYVLIVKYGEDHIPGSPFKVEV